MGARACAQRKIYKVKYKVFYGRAHARAHRGRGGAGRGPPCAAKKKNNSKTDTFANILMVNYIHCFSLSERLKLLGIRKYQFCIFYNTVINIFIVSNIVIRTNENISNS